MSVPENAWLLLIQEKSMARNQGNADLGDVIHTVESGDRLYDIAQAYYGDGNLWGQIAAANGNIPPETLRPGKPLVIPCKKSLTRAYQ